MSRFALVAVAIFSFSVGTTDGSDTWIIIPELFFDTEVGGASSSVLDDGSGSNVAEFGGSLALDARFRGGFDENRFFEFGIGGAASRLWQDKDSTVEPSRYSIAATVDGEIWSPSYKHLDRVTMGLLFGKSTADFGEINYGDTSRLMLVGMFTERADGECELGATSLFYSREGFDDTQNGGDPLFDRSDDGGYTAYGFEQTWVFGELAEDEVCYRAGPFRRLIFNRNAYVRGGWSRRQVSTQGTLVDAELDRFYVAGQVPVSPAGGVALEYGARTTLIDYTQGRYDRAIGGELGVRWSLAPSEKDWFRLFDLRLAVSGVNRDSNLDGFDYDRWAVHFGIVIHLARIPDADGSGTNGSSRVERRDDGGGGEPVVQDDVDP